MMYLVSNDDRADPTGAAAPVSSEADVLAALLARVARGDDGAFADLYDRVSPLIFGVCRRVLRDVAESEEVAQEALLEIWRTAPRFDAGRGSVKSWCATIAHARAVDRVRSSQRRRAREDAVSVPDPNPGDVVADEATARLEGERVRRAIVELSPRQRESVELAYFGGHTQSEIAGLLQVPLGTVKTRIRDGLLRLRFLMGDTDDSDGDRGTARSRDAVASTAAPPTRSPVTRPSVTRPSVTRRSSRLGRGGTT